MHLKLYNSDWKKGEMKEQIFPEIFVTVLYSVYIPESTLQSMCLM